MFLYNFWKVVKSVETDCHQLIIKHFLNRHRGIFLSLLSGSGILTCSLLDEKIVHLDCSHLLWLQKFWFHLSPSVRLLSGSFFDHITYHTSLYFYTVTVVTSSVSHSWQLRLFVSLRKVVTPSYVKYIDEWKARIWDLFCFLSDFLNR